MDTSKPHTIVGDQTPCPNCAPMINQVGQGNTTVLVPKIRNNPDPDASPKTAARRGAEEGVELELREVDIKKLLKEKEE